VPADVFFFFRRSSHLTTSLSPASARNIGHHNFLCRLFSAPNTTGVAWHPLFLIFSFFLGKFSCSVVFSLPSLIWHSEVSLAPDFATVQSTFKARTSTSEVCVPPRRSFPFQGRRPPILFPSFLFSISPKCPFLFHLHQSLIAL